MSRNLLLAALIAGASTAAIGQVVMPGSAKPVAKPVMPVMVVPVTPVTTAPVGAVTANRTILMLKNAGIVNPTLDRPITLTARAPYVDDLTFLAVSNGSYWPPRNEFIIDQPDNGVTSSWAVVSWNASPDRRYVLDCTFEGNTETANLSFHWGRDQTDSARVVGGHAGIVLPAGVQPPVHFATDRQAYLNQCDITPFGS